MKKGLFLAVFAALTAFNAQAFNVKIDNDTDGKQATTVRVQLYSLAMPRQVPGARPVRMFTLKPDRERSNRFKKGDVPVVQISVMGLDGTGKGQSAFFTIPPALRGKNIKIDIDMKKGGLLLSQDT